MRASVSWMERSQIRLYLIALVLGAAVGTFVPAVSHPAQLAINPLLALLLYITFLGVPFGRIGRAFRDGRFLAALLIVNFVVAPIVVLIVSRIVAHETVLLVGVLFVLLTPCVDYVIVFTGIAGGATDRLLAAAPILMLGQMLLLPIYLLLFVGPDFIAALDLAPFIEAFLLLIVIPLTAAGLTQLGAGLTRWGPVVQEVVLGAMVPVMMLTLAAAVASQVAGVAHQLSSLLLVVPVFVLFAAAMAAIGAVAGRIARLDVPGRRAIMFSGSTRNSLVVLPLVLALPAGFGLAPLVVVTQTLVELLIMLLFIRLVPRLITPPAAQSIDLL